MPEDETRLYQTNNVYEEVRYYWYKIKANRKKNGVKQKGNLLNYFAIGSSLRQHQERIQQFDPELEEDDEKILRKVMKKDAKRALRISKRMLKIFGKCPQVIPQLEDILSIRKIDRMHEVEVGLLTKQIDELLSQ